MAFPLPRLLRRLIASLAWHAKDHEMDQEMAFHLESIKHDYMRSGMSETEAERETRRRFGNVLRLKEQGHDILGIRVIEEMVRDIRYMARALRRSPGFAIPVVVTLALGIGANTVMFAAINGMLLKKLPVADPDSLVRLRYVGRNDMVTSSSNYGFISFGASNGRATFSYPMFQQLRVDNQTMTDLLACAPLGRVNVIVDGRADIATGFISSGNYYQLLGVPAILGRTLTQEDDRPAAPAVAVISARFWRSRLGGDSQVVGKLATINGIPVTIVGVIAPEFTGIQRAVAEAPDITVPLALDPQFSASLGESSPRTAQPTSWWLEVVGRLKPEAAPEQVQANLDAAFQRTAKAGLDSYLSGLSETERSTAVNRDRSRVPQLAVDSASRGVYDANTSDVQSVAILSVVVVLILLIACANVANLLLSRATSRQREISIRLAVGASRGRLVQQLLTESVLLAALGGALGILIGRWGQRLLPATMVPTAPFDWRVLAFVLSATAVTGIIFGLMPAFTATGGRLGIALKQGSQSAAGTRGRLSKSLLVLQVAVSLMLILGAGLFLQTLHNLRQVDVGFNPRNLVLFRVNPRLSGYDNPRINMLYEQMLDRLRLIPGVRAAALSHVALLSGSENTANIFVQGQTYVPGERPEIYRLVISPNFFDVMEMPLLLGRSLTDHDDGDTSKVAVVNEAAVREFFQNKNPIGTRFGGTVERSNQLEVVGVVRDAKYNSVRDQAPATMYVPYRQNTAAASFPTFEVRTVGDPRGVVGAIRQVVSALDPNLPITNISTQAEQLDGRFEQEKLFAQAYVLFGGVAVLIASVGLFGLMSYNVSRRTKEIGIRMALGAQRANMIRSVMWESMTLVALGVAIGLASALAVGRFISTLLFGLTATDQLTFVLAVMILLLVSAFAGYLPARRAARVDPLVALRCE